MQNACQLSNQFSKKSIHLKLQKFYPPMDFTPPQSNKALLIFYNKNASFSVSRH